MCAHLVPCCERQSSACSGPAGQSAPLSHAQVDTLPTGEIDYDHFARLLQRNRAKPAIVNVNVGTTVKVRLPRGVAP